MPCAFLWRPQFTERVRKGGRARLWPRVTRNCCSCGIFECGFTFRLNQILLQAAHTHIRIYILYIYSIYFIYIFLYSFVFLLCFLYLFFGCHPPDAACLHLAERAGKINYIRSLCVWSCPCSSLSLSLFHLCVCLQLSSCLSSICVYLIPNN